MATSDTTNAQEIRNILFKNSNVGFITDTSVKVILTKKKLTRKPTDEHSFYTYEVTIPGLDTKVFTDTEMEYSRDTAIAYFLTLVSMYALNDPLDISKLVAN